MRKAEPGASSPVDAQERNMSGAVFLEGALERCTHPTAPSAPLFRRFVLVAMPLHSLGGQPEHFTDLARWFPRKTATEIWHV
eukprot:s2610_g3.t1